MARIETGDPLDAATRIQRQVLGQSATRSDFLWEPRGAVQSTLAALACVPAVLRPLPSTFASFLAVAPTDSDSGATWWWRDPIVSAGKRPLVLVANALLAAICGWFAWRVGRVHCATSRGATFWAIAGALGGPLALFLQRLLLVRAKPETIGPGRRSLALDTCPATQTPWPAPARTGREIIDGA